MAKRKYTAEKIVTVLRQVEVRSFPNRARTKAED
jgi:hypothetical protein